MMQRGMTGSPPPFRAKPKMPPKMMADGGFGAPPPLGGPSGPMRPKSAPPMNMTDPDMDGDVDSPTVRPEALNYHDETWQCSGCQHFSGGHCNVLKMEVAPEGACNAFEAGQSENPDMDEDMGGDMGEDETDEDY